MKSLSCNLLIACSILTLAACTSVREKPQTPPDVPYTAPKIQQRINFGFVPMFPVGRPTNEVEALFLFNQAGEAYARCIGELTHAAEQEALILGSKQPK